MVVVSAKVNFNNTVRSKKRGAGLIQMISCMVVALQEYLKQPW